MTLHTRGCRNMNHSHFNAPVHFCSMCGEVVNQDIPIKKCAKDKHDKSRLQRTMYCVDCGEQLVRAR